MSLTKTIRTAALAGSIALGACNPFPPVGIMLPEEHLCIEERSWGSGGDVTQVVDWTHPDLEYSTQVGEFHKPSLRREQDAYHGKIASITKEVYAPSADNVLWSLTNAGIDSLIAKANDMHAHGTPYVSCDKP